MFKEEKNMEITLVTGNWAKIAQAKEFLEPHGIKVNNIKMDTVEIQADTVEEVAKYSAKWASEIEEFPIAVTKARFPN